MASWSLSIPPNVQAIRSALGHVLGKLRIALVSPSSIFFGWHVRWVFVFCILPVPVLLRYPVIRQRVEEMVRQGRLREIPDLKEKIDAFMKDYEGRCRRAGQSPPQPAQ